MAEKESKPEKCSEKLHLFVCVRPCINPKRDYFRQRIIQGLLNKLNPSSLTFWAPFEMFYGRKGIKSSHRKKFFELAYFFVLFDHKVKEILRSRLRAPHVKHDLFISFEGHCIVLWREESRFGFIFSLTLTKKGPFFTTFFLAIFGSFSAIELLYRTRLWAHISNMIYLTYLKILALSFEGRSLVSD